MSWVIKKWWYAWKIKRRLKVSLVVHYNEEVNILTRWREKLQAMRSNQQLKDKKNGAYMKICIMNMTWRTTLLQHTRMKFHQQNKFILDIVSGVPGMQLRFSLWLWKSWRKIFNFHEQFIVWYNLDHGHNWVWSCKRWSSWATSYVCNNLNIAWAIKVNLRWSQWMLKAKMMANIFHVEVVD